MPSECFGEVDRAMLTAGAAETNREMLEAALDISPYGRFCESKGVMFEVCDFGERVEVIDNGLIEPGQASKCLLAPGVRQRAAIEDKPAAVESIVVYIEVRWHAGFVGKAEYSDEEFSRFHESRSQLHHEDVTRMLAASEDYIYRSFPT